MTIDFKKIADKAAEYTDQSVAKTYGGDREPPAAGPCRLRFVGYVETGKHEKTYQGRTKLAEQVEITFEVSGPKHPPIDGEDGKKYPLLITLRETLSTSDKARFYKLFRVMNYAGKAKHMAQLLGEAFKGAIVHREYTKKDGTKGVAAELYDKAAGAYTIAPPRYEVVGDDGPTGEFKVLSVAAPISPIRCFIWGLADKDQWDSLFIDGEYAERKDEAGKVTAPAKSKNVIQAKIKSAKNFEGSPIHQVLLGAGLSLDIPDVDDDTPPDDDDSPAVQAAAKGPVDPPKNVTVPVQRNATRRPDPLAGVGPDVGDGGDGAPW